MVKYKCIYAEEIELYDGWEIIEILPPLQGSKSNEIIIKKEEIPTQQSKYMHECTIEELATEIAKRSKS